MPHTNTGKLQHAFSLKKKIIEREGNVKVKRKALADKLRAKKKEVGRKALVKNLTNNAHFDNSKLHKLRTGGYITHQRGANW